MTALGALLTILAAGIGWAEQHNRAPSVRQPVIDRTVAAGAAVDFRVAATDPDGDPLGFSLAAGRLPAGLALDAGGRIEGTAGPAADAYRADVAVSDGRGGKTDVVVIVHVLPAGAAGSGG